MRRNRLASILAFSATSGVAVAALACSFSEPGEFQVHEAVSDADTLVPEVQEWTIAFVGPTLGAPLPDGCETNSCADMAWFSIRATLPNPAYWPLEGSFTTESAALEGIAPAFVIETNGNVPCGEGLLAKVADPVPAGGDLFGTQFSQSVHWVCQPDDLAPWDFQVRVALVDIDGDVGPFSDWVEFSGDVGGCDNDGSDAGPESDTGLVTEAAAEPGDEEGCNAVPRAIGSESWLYAAAAAALVVRRRMTA